MPAVSEFTNPQGKKRYRVHVMRNGSVRRKDFRNLEEACHQLYLAESHKLDNLSAEQFFALRDFNVRKVIYFYLGYQWSKVKTRHITQSTFFQVLSLLTAIDSRLLDMRVGKVSQSLVEEYVPNHTRVWLRSAFSLMVKRNLMKNNPCPASVRRERKEIVIPQASEVQRLFDYTKDPCVRMFIFLCSTCGLRTSEALALKRDDIVGNAIFVKRHLTFRGIIPGTKRGTGRKISVPPQFFFLLEQLDPHASYIIYDSRNIAVPVKLQSFRACRMRPLYKALGLKFSNHALRHFAAAKWIEEGRDMPTVQRLLGHKDLATTMEYYGHLFKQPEPLNCYIQV